MGCGRVGYLDTPLSAASARIAGIEDRNTYVQGVTVDLDPLFSAAAAIIDPAARVACQAEVAYLRIFLGLLHFSGLAIVLVSLVAWALQTYL